MGLKSFMMHEDSMAEDAKDRCNVFDILRANPGLVNQVESRLNSVGIAELGYLGHGTFALCFKTPDERVVRIAKCSPDDERIHHPLILQPYTSDIISSGGESVRVETLALVNNMQGPDHILNQEAFKGPPYYGVQGITYAQKEELVRVLERCGFECPDALQGSGNFGLLKDGTPIVIDPGSVRRIPGKELVMEGDFLAPWFSQNAEGKKQWKQEALYPRSAFLSAIRKM